jgi:hypothetical protein
MKTPDEIAEAESKLDKMYREIYKNKARGRPRTAILNKLAGVGRALSWVVENYETFDELLADLGQTTSRSSK